MKKNNKRRQSIKTITQTFLQSPYFNNENTAAAAVAATATATAAGAVLRTLHRSLHGIPFRLYGYTKTHSLITHTSIGMHSCRLPPAAAAAAHERTSKQYHYLLLIHFYTCNKTPPFPIGMKRDKARCIKLRCTDRQLMMMGGNNNDSFHTASPPSPCHFFCLCFFPISKWI